MAGALAVCVQLVKPANGQSALPDKPQLAENVFKNVQVLKGISVSEFMGTMGSSRESKRATLPCFSQQTHGWLRPIYTKIKSTGLEYKRGDQGCI